LAGPNYIGQGLIVVLLGDGKGGFTPYNSNNLGLTGGNAGSFALGDFNSDGIPDIVISNQNGLVILFGDGKGGFTRAPSPSGRGAVSGEVAVANFTGNGNSDIVVVNSQGLTGHCHAHCRGKRSPRRHQGAQLFVSTAGSGDRFEQQPHTRRSGHLHCAGIGSRWPVRFQPDCIRSHGSQRRRNRALIHTQFCHRQLSHHRDNHDRRLYLQLRARQLATPIREPAIDYNIAVHVDRHLKRIARKR
jgi:hypothetical protein